MSKAKAEKFFRTEIAVEGTGHFPLDMLRYDRCHPLASEDASCMAERGHRVVLLERFSANGGIATSGRWESFCWRVIREDVRIEGDDARSLRGIGR